MKAEQLKVEEKRDAFIKAEIAKARASANLKIVNPLEQKLKEAKAQFDEDHKNMVGDRQRAMKYLQAAQNEAVSSSTAPGGDSELADNKLSKDDQEADKSTSLFRYSSKKAAESESKYEAIKMEYDALQARLVAENKKHMDEAAEKAEEGAAPAFDKAAAQDEKRVAQEAANQAKQEVDRKAGDDKVETIAAQDSDACAKCMKACTTPECSAWCQQGKWCASNAPSQPVATQPTMEQDQKSDAPQ